MASLDKAPASVQGWFAAEQAPDPEVGLRAILAPDVVLDFGAEKARGLEDVIETVGFMLPPGWLGDVVWSLLPMGKDGRVTVRGLGRDGAPLPSPGGPMSAIDFTFTLGADGLITEITPQPYDLEPEGLRAPLRPGETAPDFVLPDVDGKKVPLRQDGAKATVAVFISNNCPWAVAWHDRLQQVGRDYAARGVRFLQINANDPSVGGTGVGYLNGLEHARKRVANGDFAGPYLIDEGQKVARSWGARVTPDLFVLDARGVVAYHGAPDADVEDEALNAAWLRGALDRVLADKVPDPAETQAVGCSIKWTR